LAQLAVLRKATQPVLGRMDVSSRLWFGPWTIDGDSPVPESARWQVAEALNATRQLQRAESLGWAIWHHVTVESHWRGDSAMLSTLGVAEQAVTWEAYLRVLGLDDPVMAAALRVLESVGGVVLLDGLAIVMDRPRVVRRDLLATRLHAHREPALEWRDGATVNVWNEWILPSDFWQWTPEQVMECPDLELRRIAMEGMDISRILNVLEPVAVADDPANPGQVIELYNIDMTEAMETEPARRRRFVRVTNASPDKNGTRRAYIIQVAPWADDPVEAVATSFGVSVDAYRELARAC